MSEGVCWLESYSASSNWSVLKCARTVSVINLHFLFGPRVFASHTTNIFWLSKVIESQTFLKYKSLFVSGYDFNYRHPDDFD